MSMASTKPASDEPVPAVRLEVTLGRTPIKQALEAIAERGLDRLPSPKGEVRLLVTHEEADRLLRQGVEIHLKAVHPVRPLDPKLVLTDEQAQNELARRLKGGTRKGGQ
jgi:hypothetical protein